MVSNHKIRQELFHHLNPHPSDLNVDIPLVEMQPRQLANYVIDYFFDPVHIILYPAKSYAVAVIYSMLLEQYFSIPIKTSLRDPHLLFGNDYHYRPYQHNKEVYDIILKHMNGFHGLVYEVPQVGATVDYFLQEFFINPNPYFDNTNLHK